MELSSCITHLIDLVCKPRIRLFPVLWPVAIALVYESLVTDSSRVLVIPLRATDRKNVCLENQHCLPVHLKVKDIENYMKVLPHNNIIMCRIKLASMNWVTETYFQLSAMFNSPRRTRHQSENFLLMPIIYDVRECCTYMRMRAHQLPLPALQIT